MKFIKIFICILLVVILFTGCTFRISSSIDDLISPISPFGDNADVKEALDRYAASGYSLKMPNYGKNISSYNFYDIDGDGNDEAVAFYEPSDKLGTINLALIKKTDKEWKVVSNIVGSGKDIHSLDFAELNGDKTKELIVCWDAISNSTSHEMDVYGFNAKKQELKLLDGEKTVNSYFITDMFDDGNSELLLFQLNTNSANSPIAQLYSFTKNKFYLLGDTKLDSRISSISSIKEETVDGEVRIYADAVSSDNSVMVTELIFWSDEYNSIVSQFYSYSSRTTSETERRALVCSMDIDNNKSLEIPVDYKLKKLPKEVSSVEFMDYKDRLLVHNSYALCVEKDKYIFVVPDEYVDSISVKYLKQTREMVIYNKTDDKLVLSIKPVLKATYREADYPDWFIVHEASGYYYLAKNGNDSNIKLTKQEISDYINSFA